jgi:ATP-dependent helicase/nuclease subunit A
MSTQDELRRADAEARRQARERVDQSFIVQAPAGSGKTELLTQRFLALLAVVDRPEALLAITFTRKAAAEMRHRILEALRRCEDPASSLRDETRVLARAALSADARQGWGLLTNPSRLRVLTIDSLNQSLARRLPVLSGLGAGLGIDEQGTELYELAAERLLEHLPSGEPRVAEAVAILLGHLDNNVGRLVALIGGMLARREAWLPVLPADVAAYGDEGAARRELEAGRAGLVEAHLAALARTFPRTLFAELCGLAQGAGRVLAQAGTASPILDCGGGVPGADADDVAHWRGLAEFLLTGKGAPRRGFNKGVGVLAKDRKRPELELLKARIEAAAAEFAAQPAELHELLHSTRELPGVRYEDDEWRALKSLLLVLRVAAGELKSVFASRRAADYPEFAAAARQALGTADEPTDTALALDARLRHVLVDEFQDTSEAQVRLLESLTAGWEPGDGRTLFLVGDPMQSIYRFRNAEVGLFLDVRDRGLGTLPLEPLTLRLNFRSARPIVEWVNTCFEQVLPAHDDVLRGAVRYSHSVAAHGSVPGDGVTVHAFLRRSRVHEAQRVADIVAERQREQPDARVAILVQGRAHLVDIVQELTRRGIRYQATDIDPLGDRLPVLDLLALTRALAHPGDRAAWLAVLRAPWCGLTLADLLVLFGDDRRASGLRMLQDADRRARLGDAARARVERCLPVLEAALAERRHYGLRATVERAWHALGGPATLQDASEIDEARAYLDALGDVEARSPGGATDLARLEEALHELYATTRPSASTRVELLTVHKAKGLQFDTVIVPGLDRVGRSDTPPLLRWLKVPGQGSHPLIVAPIAEVGAASANPLHAWLGQLEREKLLQEKRRLIYVAATRAEHRLHLLGTCAVDQDDETHEYAVRAPNRECALGLLWHVADVRSPFEQRLDDVAGIDGEEDPPIPRDPPLTRVPDRWSVPVLPDGPAIVTRSVARGTSAPAVEFDWVSETARHVGTVVHRELQRRTRAVDGAFADSPPAVAALLRRYTAELAELGVPEDRREAGARRVLDALRRTLDDERGRWLLHGHRDAQSEFGLTGRLGPDVVSVVIDRTFVDPDGVRWVIDYKTSMHEGAGLDAFLDNERERYRPQLERYATLLGALEPGPIRLGLYFPLLSAWREWSAATAPELEPA